MHHFIAQACGMRHNQTPTGACVQFASQSTGIHVVQITWTKSVGQFWTESLDLRTLKPFAMENFLGNRGEKESYKAGDEVQGKDEPRLLCEEKNS